MKKIFFPTLLGVWGIIFWGIAGYRLANPSPLTIELMERGGGAIVYLALPLILFVLGAALIFSAALLMKNMSR